MEYDIIVLYLQKQKEAPPSSGRFVLEAQRAIARFAFKLLKIQLLPTIAITVDDDALLNGDCIQASVVAAVVAGLIR